MKIVHIEGGLGNQMAGYAVYVAAKASNPGEKIYIDTYLYDVKEAHSTISMWNGYELNSVFGVGIPDIRTLFTEQQVIEQIDYLRKSEFWKHDWNYTEAFIEMMKKYGINLTNAYGRVAETETGVKSCIKYSLKKMVANSSGNYLSYSLKRVLYQLFNCMRGDAGEYLYQNRPGNYFYDLTLDFMKSPFLIKTVGASVRMGLTFPVPDDEENLRYLECIKGCDSVSVHVRRTDYLIFNADCYKYGYFKKAVAYIKARIEKPVFFIFSDDLEWCKANLDILGMNSKDSMYFVGVNSGKESYRDMQLMASCRHNITTKSSFGWWGSFLNSNPEKITVCQIGTYVCTRQI